MFTRFFNVYIDGVVQQENGRVFGKGLKLLQVNSERFDINQL